MTGIKWWGAVVVSLSFVVAGCTPTGNSDPCGGKCFIDERCSLSTNTCIGMGCQTQADCPQGTYCWAATATCIGNVCTSDADCDDGNFCNGVGTCADDHRFPRARKTCKHSAPPCSVDQICDEANNTCVDACTTDDDHDGHLAASCGGDDCDDNDPNRYPGNFEICDAMGHDEDCDLTTYGKRDLDGDGYFDAICCNTLPDGGSNCGNDCNDSNPRVHPNLPEVCNHVDDNCDGAIDDEGVSVTLYVDNDHDGFGDPDAGTTQGCPGDVRDGIALYGNDCDDTNAALFPGQQRCGSSGAKIDVCQPDGTWMTTICPNQLTCVLQANGTGVCE